MSNEKNGYEALSEALQLALENCEDAQARATEASRADSRARNELNEATNRLKKAREALNVFLDAKTPR